MHTDPGSVVQGNWALPNTLEELRQPLLHTIREIGDGLAEAFPDPLAPGSRQEPLPNSWQTLAIMGERGSGKSTLLASACAELVGEKKHLVMQTMRPEHFGPTDSVITTFLADLWDTLTLEGQESEAEDASLQASRRTMRLLADTERGFAVARTTTAALEHGTDSPADFAEDFLTVSRSGVRLVRQLLELSRELCLRPDNPDGPRLIVIPIDDPDLAAHQSIVDILADLQILGSVPGIVPVTCFSPSDLSGSWRAARRKMVPEINEDRLSFLLHRHLEKLFPYRYRFEIEPIARPQRNAFAPIGQTDALRTKLKTLRESVESIGGTTWTFDEAVTSSAERYGLPSPLPDNARTLVQLWETLDAIAPEPDPSMLHLALRRLLDILTEGVSASLGASTPELLEIGSAVPDIPYKRSITADFSRVRFFVSAVGSSARDEETVPRIASIHLRRLHRVRAAIPSGESSELKPHDYLSGEVVAAMLALQEIEFGSGLFETEPDVSRLYLGSSEWQFLQVVQIVNQPTDNIFLLLPEATTLSEVLRSTALWNRLVDLSDELTVEETLATGVLAASLTIDREGQLESARDYTDAFDRACAIYQECVTEGGNAAAAYVRWFERDLPLQWHSALLSSERIRNLAARHQEMCSSMTSEHSPEDPFSSSLFEQRLGSIIKAASEQVDEDAARLNWIAGYFEFASAVGSDHLDPLSQMYSAWQRETAGIRAGATSFGSVTQVQAKQALAPYPTPEGTELVAAGRAALRRARSRARASMRRQ